MAEFQGRRIAHSYTQNNNATPQKVFPLLCPVREADWVPGWEYRMIYSRSGVAEAGCVFATPNEGHGAGQNRPSETIWIVTEYDPAAFKIGFAWINPGLVAAQIQISLSAEGRNTAADIRYTYTGLSEAGNEEVKRYDEEWFKHKMQHWEKAINHYLGSGKLISAAAWE
jgi:hypothetical protein